jgi:hypothetical protein
MALVQSVIKRSCFLCSKWKIPNRANRKIQRDGMREDSFIEERGITCSPGWGKKQRARWAQMGSAGIVLFFFSGALKTYPIPQEGRPRRLPPNNEWVGTGMGGSQPGEGGLAIPRQPAWAPNISTSSLPQC